ncbi:MAG: DUF2092 domain-containing protein [Sulfuritalea sp.]|nr:DUF2092 domain-containing protein [Sulfuritalea sp.]
MLRNCLFLASSLLAATVVWAQQVAPTQPPAASAPAVRTESQKLASDKLMEMAKFLSRQEKFSATLRVGYEVPQANGQKIEFGEIRDLAVQRQPCAHVGTGERRARQHHGVRWQDHHPAGRRDGQVYRCPSPATSTTPWCITSAT